MDPRQEPKSDEPTAPSRETELHFKYTSPSFFAAILKTKLSDDMVNSHSYQRRLGGVDVGLHCSFPIGVVNNEAITVELCLELASLKQR